MRQVLSGAVLSLILCGFWAAAQQPHVTQTLPSATVKLNGASGGGGSGTGFTYDAIEDAWIFTPASGASDTRILSDYIGLQDAAGADILAMDATLGATTYVAGRLAADAIEVRGITALSATGTITATNIQCATGGGAVVGTLNASAGNVGRFVYVTRDGANTCTIGVTSGQTLDGVTDGTTTVPSAGWKTFIQTTPTAWVTAGSYPGTGTLSGLTATKIPVATSATAVGDSAITHDSTTGDTVFAGSAPKIKLGSDVKNHISPHVSDQGIVVAGATYIVFKLNDTQIGYIGTDTYLQTLHLPSVDVDHMQVGVATVDGPSKALVDATATAFTRIGVSSGGYNGGVLVYSVFATDGTDIQTRSGSVAFSIINSGGTETCAFGTPNDVPNVTSGTLSVSFDCAAGTNTVDFRATADTSLASTTIFTIRARPDIPSGTPAVTPQ